MKTPPKELQKYLVIKTVKDSDGQSQSFRYFKTEKEAKSWAKGEPGKLTLFKVKFEWKRELP